MLVKIIFNYMCEALWTAYRSKRQGAILQETFQIRNVVPEGSKQPRLVLFGMDRVCFGLISADWQGLLKLSPCYVLAWHFVVNRSVVQVTENPPRN